MNQYQDGVVYKANSLSRKPRSRYKVPNNIESTRNNGLTTAKTTDVKLLEYCSILLIELKNQYLLQ